MSEGEWERMCGASPATAAPTPPPSPYLSFRVTTVLFMSSFLSSFWITNVVRKIKTKAINMGSRRKKGVGEVGGRCVARGRAGFRVRGMEGIPPPLTFATWSPHVRSPFTPLSVLGPPIPLGPLWGPGKGWNVSTPSKVKQGVGKWGRHWKLARQGWKLLNINTRAIYLLMSSSPTPSPTSSSLSPVSGETCCGGDAGVCIF